MFTEYWKHVWAVPCNKKGECHDELDENGCDVSNWILPTIILGVIIVLSITLFFYLYVNLNAIEKKIASMKPEIRQHEDFDLERNLQVAFWVQKEDIKQIIKLYNQELQMHGDEPKAICCLKNSLDNTTFSKVLELLEPPSSRIKTIKSKFIHLLHGARIWTSSKWNIIRNKEEYVITQSTELIFSAWKILCMVPLNIVGPLLYILDVFKDTLQVALLLVSVGGINLWVQHWTTFSSVVIECMILAIIIPIMVTVTIKERIKTIGLVKQIFALFFDVTLAVFDQIKLHYNNLLAKCTSKIIVAQNDISLAHQFGYYCKASRVMQNDMSRHIRLQQGLETIYQLALTVVLLCYARSDTKTVQGLSALFDIDGISIFGLSISAEVIMAINILLNFFGYTFANINGIRGHCEYFPFISKILLGLCILSSTLTRIIPIAMFFAPALGLFNLLFHYKAEMIGFQVLDPHLFYQPPPITPLLNLSVLHQLQRGNFSAFATEYSLYEPPNLQIYTVVPLKMYFIIFWCLHLLHILVILLIEKCWLKTGLSLWRSFITSIQKSHFPYPYNDWDVENGSCLDHIQRKRKLQQEFLVIALVNFLFNMFLLIPLVPLYYAIAERQTLLQETIGTMDIEDESYERSKLFSWLFFVIISFLTIVQIITFLLYNGPYHPMAKILKGTDNSSKGIMRNFVCKHDNIPIFDI